jgi:hypothetical protein
MIMSTGEQDWKISSDITDSDAVCFAFYKNNWTMQIYNNKKDVNRLLLAHWHLASEAEMRDFVEKLFDAELIYR